MTAVIINLAGLSVGLFHTLNRNPDGVINPLG